MHIVCFLNAMGMFVHMCLVIFMELLIFFWYTLCVHRSWGSQKLRLVQVWTCLTLNILQLLFVRHKLRDWPTQFRTTVCAKVVWQELGKNDNLYQNKKQTTPIAAATTMTTVTAVVIKVVTTTIVISGTFQSSTLQSAYHIIHVCDIVF